MLATRFRWWLFAVLLGCSGASAAVLDQIFADGFESGDTTAWEYELQIANYLSWCSVTVDGAPPTTAATIIAYFPSGTVVPLSAEPVPPFVWGYWVGTDGDLGSGDPAQTTSMTMDASAVIQACCPIAGSDCGQFP